MLTKRVQSVVALLLAFALLCSMAAGCGSKEMSGKNDAGGSQAPQQAAERTITDHAGRTVKIPSKIDKVYFTSILGQIMVYTLAPEKMAGWTVQLSDKMKKYIPAQYQRLPYLGGQQMNAKLNIEEIIKAKPDVIFSIGPDPISDATRSEADKLQQQLNIPVVVVDGDLRNTAKAYALLGQILGVEERAKMLADYCSKTLKEVAEKTKAIPDEKRVRVYYAEGPEGLATEPKGSSHALLLDLVNAVNVAEVPHKGAAGMSSVSLEQVLKWDPDVILAWGADRGGAYEKILTSPDWKNIKAVKNRRVYEIPAYPFNWFDRPPSVNRILGLKWLAALLYPDVYRIDMVKETKEFYKLFYHVDLTDSDVKELLKNAGF